MTGFDNAVAFDVAAMINRSCGSKSAYEVLFSTPPVPGASTAMRDRDDLHLRAANSVDELKRKPSQRESTVFGVRSRASALKIDIR